jgi:AcrR family transcriptional regulator
MTKRKSARERRREKLIQIGLNLFTKRGYDTISIDEIAAEADISKGLLYYYYPTKRDFYVAVLRYAAEELLHTTESDPHLPPLERLHTGLDAYLRYVEVHAATYIALLRGNLGSDAEIADVLESVRETNLQRTLSEFMPEERSSPVLVLAVVGWLGMVEMISLAWLQKPIGTRDTVCDLCVRAFLSMLRDARALDSRLTLAPYDTLL